MGEEIRVVSGHCACMLEQTFLTFLGLPNPSEVLVLMLRVRQVLE